MPPTVLVPSGALYAATVARVASHRVHGEPLGLGEMAETAGRPGWLGGHGVAARGRLDYQSEFPGPELATPEPSEPPIQVGGTDLVRCGHTMAGTPEQNVVSAYLHERIASADALSAPPRCHLRSQPAQGGPASRPPQRPATCTTTGRPGPRTTDTSSPARRSTAKKNRQAGATD